MHTHKARKRAQGVSFLCYISHSGLQRCASSSDGSERPAMVDTHTQRVRGWGGVLSEARLLFLEVESAQTSKTGHMTSTKLVYLRMDWKACEEWHQEQGKARHDTTRHDTTRHDTAKQDKARQDKARQDKTRQGKTRQNKARQDKKNKARQDKTRQDKTSQDKTRKDKTRQDKTRQDKNKTRQDKRQDKTKDKTSQG